MKTSALLASCMVAVLVVRADNVLNFERRTMTEGAIGTDVQSPTGEDDSYTWEAWVKFTDDGQIYGGHYMLSQGNDANGTVTMRTFQKKLTVIFKGKGEFSGATTITLNTWHHVALVKEPTSVKLYLDGTLDCSVSPSDLTGSPAKFPALPTDAWNCFNIGSILVSRFDSASFTFGGHIADVRVWGVARTQAELVAAKDSRLTGRENGLVGYWPVAEAAVGAHSIKNYVTGNDAIVPMTTNTDKNGVTVTNVTVVADASLDLGDVGKVMLPVKCMDLNTTTATSESLASRYTYVKANEDFTFEAWVKMDKKTADLANFKNSTGVKLFQQYYGGGVGRMTFVFLEGDAAGGYAQLWYNGPGNKSCFVKTTEKMPLDTWTHLAVCVKDGDQKIYFDGREVASAAHPYAGFYQPPECTSAYTGAMFGLVPAVYCKIREERLWHVYRSAADVIDSIDDTLTGNERGLSFYNAWSKDAGWDGYINEVRHSPWKDVDQVPWPISGEGPWINYPTDKSDFVFDLKPALPVNTDPTTSFATLNGTMGAFVDTKAAITTKDFAFETWYYPRVFDNTIDVIAAQYNGGANGRLSFNLVKGVPNFSITTSDGSQGTSGNLAAPSAIPLNKWSHLAISREGGTWTIYVNGEPVVSESGRTTCDICPGRTLNIGHCSVTKNRACTGSFAEARLWNYARSAKEIAKFYQYRVDGTSSGLVGAWPLQAREDRSVTDKTGKTSTGVANVGWTSAAPLVFKGEVTGDARGMVLIFR